MRSPWARQNDGWARGGDRRETGEDARAGVRALWDRGRGLRARWKDHQGGGDAASAVADGQVAAAVADGQVAADPQRLGVDPQAQPANAETPAADPNTPAADPETPRGSSEAAGQDPGDDGTPESAEEAPRTAEGDSGGVRQEPARDGWRLAARLRHLWAPVQNLAARIQPWSRLGNLWSRVPHLWARLRDLWTHVPVVGDMRRENARKRVPILVAVLLVVLAVAFAAVQLTRPLPLPAARLFPPATLSRVPGPAPAIPWPAQGETAIDVEGVGTLGSAGGDAPLPIASVTKIMTALLVLEDHPLAPMAPGPLLTVAPADVLTYASDAASEQSVVPVTAGEQLSELDALEGLLLPSGNNIAQMLAVWDAGSSEAFVSKMNARAADLGLRHTHYVGPSGLETGNVSTAADMVRLAEVALEIPVFAAVVAMPSATVPVAGVLANVNYNLGRDGIVGVKTGSTDAAGGCYVFAARTLVGMQSHLVVGAVLGQQGLTTALSEGDQLVGSASSSLRETRLLRRGQTLGRVGAPWASSVPVVAGHGLEVLTVPGTRLTTRVHLQTLDRHVARGAHVGELSVWLGARQFTIPLLASGDLPGPSLLWRLGRL